MTLTRYDDYAGKDKAKSRGVIMRMYTELSTGYTDVLAGNLDILKSLPPDAYASAKDVFKDRYMGQPSPDITTLGFPMYDPRYADVRVRRALSMAIDEGHRRRDLPGHSGGGLRLLRTAHRGRLPRERLRTVVRVPAGGGQKASRGG